MSVHTTIAMSSFPSTLPVGSVPESDWSLRRRKGNRVRYQNNVTAVWDSKFSLEPGDVLYREIDPELYGEVQEAPNSRLTDTLKPEVTVKASNTAPGDFEADKVTVEVSTTVPLEEHTRDDLRALCKQFKLTGYGKLNKAGLIALLNENGVLS
ncbi:hypothetical protein BH789_gp060 [Gordonia phage GMA6]|uniref:Rho termination factor N-terminal domain-containing protein n=1 Tax=Gordonia phage GMA6 TaxID=1647285 RepID=A0A0K0NKT2_9CAUD|nr:hypothetical protein BH789_gp060 [Gordonia phage GMA6]AKL88341.1 hypothetical protein GMA6_60 [Gordonia phage GMA6]